MPDRRLIGSPQLGWYFEPVGAMGGASSGAYQNSLAGVGVPPPELFAREAVQNSVDAAQEKATSVFVRFQTDEAAGAKLDGIRSAIGLTAGSEPLRRPGLLPPAQGQNLDTILRRPLSLLYVEDFNTLGLGGTTEPIAATEEDNYFRLCLMLGDTRESEGRGGTFGYGKSVYWAMSSLWTVVLYSRFRATPRTQGVSARLLGVSWFNVHTARDAASREVRYTGRAWFGVKGENECQPIVDDDAHALAERLGFERRGPDQLGLSILILGSTVDMDALRAGVERHWWPRLLDDRLKIGFSERGQELPPPRPRSASNLKRFVRSWEFEKGQLEPRGRDLVKEIVHKRTALGRLAMTTGSEDEPEEFGDPQGASRRVEIALVRDPGMVVEYFEGPMLSPSQPTCAGLFVADPELNGVFSRSEPPAHNKWDSQTIRRDRPLSDEERKQIVAALDKIRSAARQFVQSKQTPPPKPPARCRELEKMLGKWIGLDAHPPPPPPPGTDPFQIRFVEEVERVRDQDGITLDAKVEIALRDDAEVEPENLVRVRAWIDTVVDEGSPAGREERLRMTYMVAMEPDGVETIGEDDTLSSYVGIVLMRGGSAQVIDLRSQPLPHSEYRAVLRVSAEIVP